MSPEEIAAYNAEWLQAWKESERDGVLVANAANSFLSPTSFSALK